jgi:hypothetical protein
MDLSIDMAEATFAKGTVLIANNAVAPKAIIRIVMVISAVFAG